ncbi:hypothetical protein DYB37_013184 [Aphanomyces astaci]|uniref:Uncharacterized protein n=1 Tax=Aphanomyces astaci TaxID=112090 RepID=A0A397BL73_APHAT|nr:hypothetical protein DYB25_011920 [Aphanomyces astaci]RHY99962.1 hypothetical protein DYB35_013068 [Aphanomyces astaci]RHZ14226.1 hypothetical protein DYB37_013184 [Aphanomyces astaci]
MMLWELLQPPPSPLTMLPTTPPPPPSFVDLSYWCAAVAPLSPSTDGYDDLDQCFPTFGAPDVADAAPKCGYRTGKCDLRRGLKRNGTYHKLCDVHREKANWNQKKLDRKKRQRKDLGHIPAKEVGGDGGGRNAFVETLTSSQHATWAAEELAFFCHVMTPPPSPVEWPKETNDDDDAALDLLFKAEVMVLVDRWAPS